MLRSTVLWNVKLYIPVSVICFFLRSGAILCLNFTFCILHFIFCILVSVSCFLLCNGTIYCFHLRFYILNFAIYILHFTFLFLWHASCCVVAPDKNCCFCFSKDFSRIRLFCFSKDFFRIRPPQICVWRMQTREWRPDNFFWNMFHTWLIHILSPL